MNNRNNNEQQQKTKQCVFQFLRRHHRQKNFIRRIHTRVDGISFFTELSPEYEYRVEPSLLLPVVLPPTTTSSSTRFETITTRIRKIPLMID
jgi:hypothetical protein